MSQAAEWNALCEEVRRTMPTDLATRDLSEVTSEEWRSQPPDFLEAWNRFRKYSPQATVYETLSVMCGPCGRVLGNVVVRDRKVVLGSAVGRVLSRSRPHQRAAWDVAPGTSI